MNYAARATHALKTNYPEFWRELHADPPGAQAMLVGYWHLFLKQARKKNLRPGRAASDFVASARTRRVPCSTRGRADRTLPLTRHPCA